MLYTSPLTCNATTASIIHATPDVPRQELASNELAYYASMACLNSTDATVANEAPRTWIKMSEYGYIPSAGAGIFFLIAFGLSFLIHAYQLVRSRRWLYLCAEAGLALESWGWGERYSSSHCETFDISSGYVLQLAGLTVAPTMFAANIYCLFTQFAATQAPALMRGIGVSKPQFWLIVFEVFTIVVQVAGAALAATTSDKALFKAGCNIMLAGIVLQLVLTVLFLAVVVLYFNRLRRATYEQVLNVRSRMGLLFYGIVVMDVLIIIRGAYRTVELSGGIWGPAGLIIGDAIPMMLVAFGLNATHAMWTVVPFEGQKQGSADIGLVRYDASASQGSGLEKAERAY
ncbi:hypothetical protein JCM10296v2_006669 [Rhodotorula toruloides]